jgi:hypothetical protein
MLNPRFLSAHLSAHKRNGGNVEGSGGSREAEEGR